VKGDVDLFGEVNITHELGTTKWRADDGANMLEIHKPEVGSGWMMVLSVNDEYTIVWRIPPVEAFLLAKMLVKDHPWQIDDTETDYLQFLDSSNDFMLEEMQRLEAENQMMMDAIWKIREEQAKTKGER